MPLGPIPIRTTSSTIISIRQPTFPNIDTLIRTILSLNLTITIITRQKGA
jgi:hypothetical protein